MGVEGGITLPSLLTQYGPETAQIATSQESSEMLDRLSFGV